MKRAATVHPADLWKINDTTDICLTMKRLPHAHIRDQNGRLALIRQEDWPEICRQCHLLVMHSCMSIHKQNRIYCTHASLTKIFSPGVCALNRFSWYPGNPRLHLHKVEKLHLLALLALHSSEIKEMRAALMPLLVSTGLFLCGIDSHPINITLTFLMAPPTGTLWSLMMLALHNSSANAAVWVYKHYIRNNLRRFESNLFGGIRHEPSNMFPLEEVLLPHEIPVPTDDFENENGTASNPLPGRSNADLGRTPFFSAGTVTALEAGFNAN
jgi:hypothetical protein